MIKVTVELISAISPDRDRHLGTMYIENDRTGTPTIGNYQAKLTKFKSQTVVWRVAKCLGFNRKRESPWYLVYLLLKDVFVTQRGGV